ncbi:MULTISPECIES: ExbD/TolR family protein [unclassified Campylobacter]|uniref:ExbD/TolR family protein n=1 Tax=unclassified Campylobacter TaxID=2593542 RepID=UPI0014521C00|nr:biopolymer transporter ExbD [Campylobacter sp. RM16192]QCD52186.1 TonB system transport protein ExbD [Campylobacter sp. RM16192]
MKFVRRSRHKSASISMLNLIDVIFVLLLFFMVTTTFNKFAHIDIALPETKSNLEDNENDVVQLFYLIDGGLILKINETEKILNSEILKDEISNLSPAHKKNITLNADEAINYGKVVDVISVLKDANVQNVELNIKKK